MKHVEVYKTENGAIILKIQHMTEEAIKYLRRKSKRMLGADEFHVKDLGEGRMRVRIWWD
jgi:hypothetical protein